MVNSTNRSMHLAPRLKYSMGSCPSPARESWTHSSHSSLNMARASSLRTGCPSTRLPSARAMVRRREMSMHSDSESLQSSDTTERR